MGMNSLASRNVDPGPIGQGGPTITNTRVVTANGTVNTPVAIDGAHSIAVIINITAFTSGTLTVTVKGSSASGAQYTLLASSALGSAATTVLRISPDLTASANAIAQDIVPPNLVVSAVAAGGASLTYSIDVECGY